MKIEKGLKISILKFLSYIQLSKIHKMIDKKRKTNMNLSLLKEIFWVLSLLEEMINQHYFIKKSKSSKQLLQKVKLHLEKE
jgi:hypothetical protein